MRAYYAKPPKLQRKGGRARAWQPRRTKFTKFDPRSDFAPWQAPLLLLSGFRYLRTGKASLNPSLERSRVGWVLDITNRTRRLLLTRMYLISMRRSPLIVFLFLILLGQEMATAPVADGPLRLQGPQLICLEGCEYASVIRKVPCARFNGRKWICNAANLPVDLVLKTQLLFSQVISSDPYSPDSKRNGLHRLLLH